MTDAAATRRASGYRRVLRHLAAAKEGRVVPTNPPSIDDLAAHALNVVKACADPNIVFDFSSDTTTEGETFVVTLRFTPKRTK